ncbi:carbonic anhydrase [Rhizoclosmatium globosum]|uniref:carbonic anhydrase n=1 Tax=Rhizoclosmatium globosum TaxID=329046 RepID=A0A1Y2C579_9FUNG|nr:carbonic anhydrase [Rhizoclosmatium globosum]|eukprot:ORY42181.1 carbonic anhydrase [Rhizoclosmatium globosum]
MAMLAKGLLITSFLSALTVAAAANDFTYGEYNCMGDVIRARGLEIKSLESKRRASWSYEGETGVSKWGEYSTTCITGEYQSPINFEGETFAIDKKPTLEWTNFTNKFDFFNNGHTVQLELKQSQPNLLTHEIDKRDYTVQQVHFHSPSEHHVDDKYQPFSDFPLEAHFVHVSADKKLNVIGLFFEIGPEDNPWIRQFVDLLPEKENTTTKIASLDMTSIITQISNARFFSYTGSLTTPPCTEGVLWLVAREPLKVSLAQLNKLTKVMPFNSRTTQANKSGKNATVTPAVSVTAPVSSPVPVSASAAAIATATSQKSVLVSKSTKASIVISFVTSLLIFV